MKDKLFARIREEGDVLLVWCEDVGEPELLTESWRLRAPAKVVAEYDARHAGG